MGGDRGTPPTGTPAHGVTCEHHRHPAPRRHPGRPSGRLAQPTTAGVVEHHRTPGRPPRVHYALTADGRALEPVMRSMWE
ncbi:winged helix-turn-helix transcriptional regulator [Streptomyces sp. NPDC047000]|uniref:winged helix-turn-helix transcriptional regulator n=1 Tax=Streptomyces sp. NPDC047000 TaxID=3155474 RepID=UPI0033CFDDF0